MVYHCEFECLVNGVPATQPDNACHTWPTSYTGYSFEATDMILDFFRENGLGSSTAISNSINVSIYNNMYNPLSHEAKIVLQLSGNQRVNLAVYNLSGKRILPLIDNQLMKQGKHSVRINNMRLSKGAYILRLRAGDNFYSKKMLIVM